MEKSEIEFSNHEKDSQFTPGTSAGRVLIPLLDALNWQGDKNKMMEALVDHVETMDTNDLVDTMANLNFRIVKIGKMSVNNIEERLLPLLVVKRKHHILVLNIDKEVVDGKRYALIYDGELGVYSQVESKSIHGEISFFQYANEMSDSLIEPQNNWFNKLLYRFRKSIMSLTLLTLLITVLDLMLPLLVVMIYDRVLLSQNIEPLIYTSVGIVIYLVSSYTLNSLRANILNYVSTRMGSIISIQTFTRLVYLSPSYTETASINSQLARIKDFEGLKNFVSGGSFIALFDLAFSGIYVVAIILMGGWIGIIPLLTMTALILLGMVMRPFHKIKMEKQSETSVQRQQSLLEVLRNTNEIKFSGSKKKWIERIQKNTGEHIVSSYNLSNYVSLSNNISYFITNVSVLIMIYGGVLQIFAGRMTTGALIGVLMLYWKAIGPIRSAFNLSIQVNGLLKSIAQINRFMKLPQDSSLKTSMSTTKDIKGHVKFTDVSIRYTPDATPALLNVSFTNSPGQILGITGHDGAGKTTVLKIILGMYKPQVGRVIIDNVNIKQLEPLSLRRSISYAPERDMLLEGTFRDNFKSYNPTITDEEIMALSDQTGLSHFFNLFGVHLDTEINEQIALNLSPAFKKIFCLTRMLARNVKLYLIDEPENHLDVESLKKIGLIFEMLAKERDAAVIISTKNKEILKICNQVIHLNQGRMIVKN